MSERGVYIAGRDVVQVKVGGGRLRCGQARLTLNPGAFNCIEYRERDIQCSTGNGKFDNGKRASRARKLEFEMYRPGTPDPACLCRQPAAGSPRGNRNDGIGTIPCALPTVSKKKIVVCCAIMGFQPSVTFLRLHFGYIAMRRQWKHNAEKMCRKKCGHLINLL